MSIGFAATAAIVALVAGIAYIEKLKADLKRDVMAYKIPDDIDSTGPLVGWESD